MAVVAARALDDGRVVLVDRDLLRLAEVFERERLELDPEVLGDGAAVGQDRDVFEHGLPAIAVTRRLDRGDLERAAQLVDDERRERFALDVLRDDQQRTAGARATSSSSGSRSFIALIFFSWMRMNGLLEHDFHALGIGHEIRREVAAIELHALDDLERRLERLALFDGDDAVLADLLHRVGDDPPDRLVVVRRDRADLRDHRSRSPASTSSPARR